MSGEGLECVCVSLAIAAVGVAVARRIAAVVAVRRQRRRRKARLCECLLWRRVDAGQKAQQCLLSEFLRALRAPRVRLLKGTLADIYRGDTRPGA